MKLSTYIERFMERGWRRESAEDAAILAKEAGVQWDPEEPELPEKVRISCIGEGTREHPWVHVLVPEDEKDGYRDSDDHEITPEAAARYNAVDSFFAWCARNEAIKMYPGAVASVLRRDIEDERELLSLRKGTLIVDPKVFR